MIRYIVRRMLAGIAVVFVASVVTFLIFQLGPKLAHLNPALLYVGKIPPRGAALNEVNHKFGFDLPWWEQYFNWLKGIFAGRDVSDGTTTLHCSAPCLGYSFRNNLPVTHMIWQALPIEISLAIGAAILWLVIGVSVGTLSALRRGTFVDRLGMTIALAGVSLPIFFTGPVLQLVFEFDLKWIPDQQYVSFFNNPFGWFKSFILAWIALAFLFSALYARLTRASMLETMNEDYIRTARAKGLSRRVVVTRHGLRAALTPIVTIFGLDIGQLIGTAVITETVFNLHGLGLISIIAITNLDLPVVLGVTIIATLAVVIANIIVDVAYAAVDPRVSYT